MGMLHFVLELEAFFHLKEIKGNIGSVLDTIPLPIKNN